MTALVDLDGPRLWAFIDDRSKNELVGRLEALGEGVLSIKAAVIDPSAGYKAAGPGTSPDRVWGAPQRRSKRTGATNSNAPYR